MECKIERAKLKHLKEIQRLNKLLFDHEIINKFDITLVPNWSLGAEGTSYFRNAITKNSFISFVALVKNKVVGYLVGEVLKKPISWRIIRKQAELANMFVRPEYRNKQIGSKLVQAFIKVVKEKGINNIKVVASAGNQKAISFYRYHGFYDHELILEINFPDKIKI